MRSLFAKILLWFWLAFAVIIAALALLESAERQRAISVPVRPGEPFAILAELASDVLAREGRGGLTHLLARFETGSRVHVFCIDSTGADVRGRAVPPGVEATGRDVIRRGVGRARIGGNRFAVGYPLRDRDGTRLALVLEPPPRRRELFHVHDLWLQAVVLILLGGLLCYLLARYITAPVARLRGATRRLAEGDLSARVGSGERKRRDELEDLGRDFDGMAERMESMVSAQRRLLTDISHELRSPLARINVALGLLRQGGAKDTDGMLTRLETEAERLNRLIGDLLTLSRLESGGPAAAKQAVDLSQLVSEVVGDARLEASARKCEVRVTQPSTLSVQGVPELLRSAIENVVRNAVRHTAESTAVEVAVEERSGSNGPVAVVEVRDHGPGVPRDQIERIFEPFYRVDQSRERRSGGVGLGLAIARRAVLQHGGEIEAFPGEGGGLLVEIRVPIVAPR